MAPPSHARMNAQGKGYASRLESPIAAKKVTKPVQEPQKPKMKRFPEFPNEIQDMIWCESMEKPACHTLKFIQTKPGTADNASPNGYIWDFAAIPIHQDPSSYRYWKSMLWCRKYKQPSVDLTEEKASKKKASGKVAEKRKVEKPKLQGPDVKKFYKEKTNLENQAKLNRRKTRSRSKAQEIPRKSGVEMSHEAFSKLANGSFQTGFNNSMVQLEKITSGIQPDMRDIAVLDVATDLVILEFNRGENARPNSWFEYTGLGDMDIHGTRNKTRHLKRVAVHYKKEHAKSDKRGPFQCWCANPAALACNDYRACPLEQACFLDCFANLEEFYYVIEIKRNEQDTWVKGYRDYVRDCNYMVRVSDDEKRPKLRLAHFFDHKYKYLQLMPLKFIRFLPKPLFKSWPPIGPQPAPRDCLEKVINIYMGRTGKDDFNNPLEQRRKTKFGILMATKHDDDIENDDETKDQGTAC